MKTQIYFSVIYQRGNINPYLPRSAELFKSESIIELLL